MTWTINWAPRALKDAGHLSSSVQQRVNAAIERFAESEHGDVKRLQGVDPPTWRLRVGDYRVLLRFDYELQTLRILRVLPRGRAYRD